MTKPMTLAEAISLGAHERQQAFGGVFDPRTGGSDAFGAALDAIMGVRVPTDGNEGEYLRVLAERFPELVAGGPQTCPACGRESDERDATIVIGVHMNDDHRWTREEIAAWVMVRQPSRSR